MLCPAEIQEITIQRNRINEKNQSLSGRVAVWRPLTVFNCSGGVRAANCYECFVVYLSVRVA